jgi:hypothetical protein
LKNVSPDKVEGKRTGVYIICNLKDFVNFVLVVW